MAFKCYVCGQENQLLVNPVQEVNTDQETIVLFYPDTIHAACPKCGQKYAIPNSQKKKVIDSNRRNPAL